MKRYRAVSLFSGCGGFCEGVRLAGFDVTAAVEQDRYACETYRHNFPEVPLFEGDVQDFLNPESLQWTEKKKLFDSMLDEPVDLVFGGPPCQGYSQIGPRSFNDPRNVLYRQFIRVLDTLHPKVFLMENVPNMLLLAEGKFKRDVLASLREAGYGNSGVILVAADDFGVPQSRRRAIFFGVRDDFTLEMAADTFLAAAIDGEKQPLSIVRDAIYDIPWRTSSDNNPTGYPQTELHSDILDELRLDRDGRWYTSAYKKAQVGGNVALYNHHTKGVQGRRRKIIKKLKPGQNARSLPEGMWVGVRAEKWRRLHPERPAYTILAQMHRDLSEWIHPKYNRWISVREAARLQSFHDGFIFKTSEYQMLKQVGNAVPPLLGRALASSALAALGHIDRGAEVVPLLRRGQQAPPFGAEPDVATG